VTTFSNAHHKVSPKKGITLIAICLTSDQLIAEKNLTFYLVISSFTPTPPLMPAIEDPAKLHLYLLYREGARLYTGRHSRQSEFGPMYASAK
jgi:hypothetical protein